MNSITKPTHELGTEEIDVSALMHQLWGNKWLILSISAITLSMGIFIASKKAPEYKSNVLLQIDVKHSNIGGAPGNAMQQLLNGSSSDSSATQIALIKSRFILEPVIKELRLDINSYFQPSSIIDRWFTKPKNYKVDIVTLNVPRSMINKKLTLRVDTPETISLYNQDGVILLRGKIGDLLVSANKKIQLKVSSLNAPLGSKFRVIKHSNAKELTTLLSSLSIEESGMDTNQSTGVLDLSLKGEDPQLTIDILNAIANTSRLKDAQKKAQEASQILSFLYKQLPETKRLLEKSELALNHYRAKSGKIDIKLQTQYLLNQLTGIEKKQADLQIKKIQMMQGYTKSHPLLIALNLQIKTLHEQTKALESNIKKLPESDQIAINLMRDVKVKQTLYMVLLNKIQELEVIKAGTISGVSILSYAEYPDAPLPNKNKIIYLGSIILGLALSMLYIFGRKILFPRVDDPEWSERRFNLPTLAMVPYCNQQAENTVDFQKHKTNKMPLLAHAYPRNLAIESLRSLRTNLQVTLATANNNVVSILGVSPGVGKSFISANLAFLLASCGKSVLLVDADLRRGTIHKYFNQPASPGLSNILSDPKIDHSNALHTSTIHPNLTLLPRGDYPKNPSELLMSEEFKNIIQKLSKEYDVIVMDTAPVLLVTDAVVVSSLSATNYLVLGAGSHQPTDIELVIKRLQSSDIEVHGSIFNFHREEIKSRYYGKSYYSYKYNNSYYYDEA